MYQGNHPSNPGPGEYKTVQCSKGPAYTLAGRAKQRQGVDQAPGPGHYNVSGASAPGPAYTITGRQLEGQKAVRTPGPGHYDVALDACQGPAYSLPTAQPDEKEAPTQPGPGAGGKVG